MHELVPSGLPLGQKKHTTRSYHVNQESWLMAQILHAVVPARTQDPLLAKLSGSPRLSLLQCSNSRILMADWKQITARIRRAKGSKDPVGQLSNLFQKTRDAMVAFELARYLETASKSEEAVKWYAISWQRFRRGDWKTKALEAVTRLGGVLPAEGEVLPVPEVLRIETQESQPPAEAPLKDSENAESLSEPVA